MAIPRPTAFDYAPFYAPYVKAVPEGVDVRFMLEAQLDEVRGLFGALSEAQGLFRYAEGKWSLKELLGHLADAERVFGYRAMCVARGEQKPLPGFDEDAYVATARFDARPLKELVTDFVLARQANLSLFDGFTEEAWSRIGNANSVQIKACGFPYFCAGHAAHHLAVIRERYLDSLR
ncbi:MAG TPA: DinB family protein [Holophagaceae bacterium]|nr:DinB family protein [Holophagaceae bacterium]